MKIKFVIFIKRDLLKELGLKSKGKKPTLMNASSNYS